MHKDLKEESIVRKVGGQLKIRPIKWAVHFEGDSPIFEEIIAEDRKATSQGK